MLSLSKDFVHYFRCSRSGQVHSFMAALTCLCSAETNLTLTCPSPKSFVCNLPDSGRHGTSIYQGLSLSCSIGRVHCRREPWERGCVLNPLSPNSDHRQFSPNNIHMLPREMVMRVNKMISKDKILWSVIKLSQLIKKCMKISMESLYVDIGA